MSETTKEPSMGDGPWDDSWALEDAEQFAELDRMAERQDKELNG